MVAGRRVSRVEHLPARHRAEPERDDDKLAAPSGHYDSAPVRYRPLEGVVLCVGQAGVRCT